MLDLPLSVLTNHPSVVDMMTLIEGRIVSLTNNWVVLGTHLWTGLCWTEEGGQHDSSDVGCSNRGLLNALGNWPLKNSVICFWACAWLTAGDNSVRVQCVLALLAVSQRYPQWTMTRSCTLLCSLGQCTVAMMLWSGLIVVSVVRRCLDMSPFHPASLVICWAKCATAHLRCMR